MRQTYHKPANHSPELQRSRLKVTADRQFLKSYLKFQQESGSEEWKLWDSSLPNFETIQGLLDNVDVNVTGPSAIAATSLYRALPEKLMAKYRRPAEDFALQDRISELQQLFPNPSAVANQRILDLGCGASFGVAENSGLPGTWDPWFLRAAAELGAKGIGVDIGDNFDTEPFEYHQIDLRQKGALDFFPAHSFHAIHCTNLFNSPQLVYSLGYYDEELRKEMLQEVIKQCSRLLAPGGGLLFDSELKGF